MVALSVSISASTSPFFTGSPTFFCQVAITPSVMVSLRRGISTTSSILEMSMVTACGLASATGAVASADGTCGATASVFGCSALGASAVGTGAASEATAAAPPPVFCAINAATSSPCLPMIASKSFTCNFAPSFPPRCSSTPSL